MKQLRKPGRLQPGDRVATVSLSWGAAGVPAIRWRYDLGKSRLERQFGLKVVEMPHTLASEDYVRDHPEKRAQDLMEAFSDRSIRGILSVIGGSDSIRMLPYMDFSVLQKNPKIFTGYSDGTVTDFICRKAGLSSFYGGHVLNDFGEPGEMPGYTAGLVRRMLFSNMPVGEILPSPVVGITDPGWIDPDIRREYGPDFGYQSLRRGKVRGRLIGGCFEVFPDIFGTILEPPLEDFDGAILFFEVCGKPNEKKYRTALSQWGEKGILQRVGGLLMGKPLGNMEEYQMLNRVTLEVLDAYGRQDMPVLANASFGHNSPSGILPMGAMAELDCDSGRFVVLESAVQ